MDCRQHGSSGRRVPVLYFGTGTFGESGPLFGTWGSSDAASAITPPCPHTPYFRQAGFARLNPPLV